MFKLMGVPVPDQSAFYRTIIPLMSQVVQELTDELLQNIRLSLNDGRSLSVVMDCGWSHPGWWAKEATVVALDGESGLPVGYINVIKGSNYFGSSKGKQLTALVCYLNYVSIGMEGWGALQIMKELQACGIKVVNLLHDNDASTFNNVLEVFKDVSEALCVSKLY